MPSWTPAAVRARDHLSISPAEKSGFEARYATMGLLAHASFHGGGLVPFAFLGAARCAHDLGLRWQHLSGSSGGALIASLLATDLPFDAIEYHFGKVDERLFLQPQTPKLAGPQPGRELDDPIPYLTQLALQNSRGAYRSDRLAAWLDEVLTHAGIPTFGSVSESPSAPRHRHLRIIVSDLTRGEPVTLPDDLEPTRQRQFRLSEAVRASMSVPFLFEPVTLERAGGVSVVADGGLFGPGPVPTDASIPLYAFRLVDRTGSRSLTTTSAILAAIFRGLALSPQRHAGIEIEIDITGLDMSPAAFQAPPDLKDALYARGYRSTKRALLRETRSPIGSSLY